ncbi:hypothetical protein TYRP_015712 [Tyrophagus putrescentiae]|nr:hypothetical protein TYRP_015712 [Tyrophagus putrescentiae]
MFRDIDRKGYPIKHSAILTFMSRSKLSLPESFFEVFEEAAEAASEVKFSTCLEMFSACRRLASASAWYCACWLISVASRLMMKRQKSEKPLM